MQKSYLIGILTFLLLLSSTESAFACLCYLGPPEKAFAQAKKKASLIFTGQAIEVINGFQTGEFRGWRAKFKVTQYWKGTPTQEVIIFTGPDDCANDFIVGKNYLVLSYLPNGEQQWRTNRCMFTGPVELKQDNLKRLGKSKVLNQSS